MAEVTALSRQSGVSLFHAMNLVLLSYVEQVGDSMTGVQRRAFVVASEFWRNSTRTAQDLLDAREEVLEELDVIDPSGCIIGFEAHMAQSVLTVTMPEADEGLGEEWHCRDTVEWFPKSMWDWCDLTVDECLCLSACLSVAVRAGRFHRPSDRYALAGATMLREQAEPGAGIEVGEFLVTVPIDTVPQCPAQFGDLSLIGTAVGHVAATYDDDEAARRTKSTLADWLRLKSLFAPEYVP